MSEWRDISTAPRDGVFVLLHNDNWASDVEGFWHKGRQSWSANTRIPGIENRVITDALETTDGRRREILRPRPLGPQAGHHIDPVTGVDLFES
jgi:hypothetical protein